MEKVGLVAVGLGGVGSSMLAGVLAAREHLVHPSGSLALTSLRDQAPFALLPDLELGAFELYDDDAYRAATRAGLVSRSILDELRPRLREIRAMTFARQAPTRRHLADALAEDLRGFLAHHRCARGVLVCTIPGPHVPAPPVFTAAEVHEALEESADWVTPAVVYAAAAADAGCGFVAASSDGALCAPGVAALFAERGLPLAGAGLLGPEALMRELLAQALSLEAVPLAGAASMSAQDRGQERWVGPDRASEMALGPTWAGGVFELSVELRGQVALHKSARALDAALLVELAQRAGRAGAQDWMHALFAMPLGAGAPREAAAPSIAERRARLLAELPALARSVSLVAA